MDFSGATESGGSRGDVFAGTRGPEAFGDTVTGATAMGCCPTRWGSGVKLPSPPRQVCAATRLSSANLAMTRLSAAPVPLPDLAEVTTASSTSSRALIALTHPADCRRSFDRAAIAIVASAAARATNRMRMNLGFVAASIVQFGCSACHPAAGEPGQALETRWLASASCSFVMRPVLRVGTCPRVFAGPTNLPSTPRSERPGRRRAAAVACAIVKRHQELTPGRAVFTTRRQSRIPQATTA